MRNLPGNAARRTRLGSEDGRVDRHQERPAAAGTEPVRVLRWFRSGLTLVSKAAAIVLALQETVNQLAYAIVQAVAVLAGIITAQQWSRYSVKDAAADMVCPYATSSIRHLLTLGKSIATTQRRISEETGLLAGDGSSDTVSRQSVEIIARVAVDELQVSLDIAADATESWRDVVPETVRRIVDEPSEQPGN